MTTTPDLDQLERDLQETREKLARDLDRLRSTETISGFKADLLAQVSETKDDLVGKAKASVTAGVQDVWDEVKARAAANTRPLRLPWALGLLGAFCSVRRSRPRLWASA